ncbi:MAG: ArsR/SmtB family transcription factor [Bacillota bacterium]
MNWTILNALAEPNRLQIVELLREGPLTVGKIGDRLRIRQPQASKHLGVLLEAGVVEVYAVANRRIYKLRSEPFQQLRSWLEYYRVMWDDKFDNLEPYLQELQKKVNTLEKS